MTQAGKKKKDKWYVVVQQSPLKDRVGATRIKAADFGRAVRGARALAPKQYTDHPQFKTLIVTGPFKKKPRLAPCHSSVFPWEERGPSKAMRARVVIDGRGLRLRLLGGMDESDCILSAGLQVGDEITLTASDKKPTWNCK